jgi:predicted transcriptional regulator
MSGPTRDWFVEQMGLTAEADGLSRIAGRLFGALLLSDAPRSLDELTEQLGASKASVSTEARRLLERGVVERAAKPSDRRDYYQLAPDFFDRLIRRRVERWEALHRLVVRMQAEQPDQAPAVRERFAYIDGVHAFVLSRVDDALREWRLRGARQARGERAVGGRGAGRAARAKASAAARKEGKGGRRRLG